MPKVSIAQDLTQPEEKELWTQLTKALDAVEQVKKEAAETAGEFRSKLKGLEARVHELKETLKSGSGQVEIDVEERPGPGGVIELFALDDGRKVGERPMNDKDRQGALPFPGSDGAPREDEQEAETPAEAEALRTKRLRAEHADRTLGLVAGARENVVVSALDGGGFLAALLLEVVEGEEPKALRETGETEDEAREKVLALYTESLPKFEEPQPSWDDVVAASQEQTRAEEIAALAGEQAQDAVADAAEPDAAPAEGPKTRLKAPKGKRAKRLRLEDSAGNEIPPETIAAAAAGEASLDAGAPESGGDGAPAETPECEIGCEQDHEHSAGWTAF